MNTQQNKHRIAFIGGFSSVAQARRELPPSCELVALCDVRADLIAACKNEDNTIFCTTNFQEIADLPSCDSVVTFTPNATHKPIAIACLSGGKNIFIEKPMGLNLEEGREILRAEKASGKHCAVDLEVRMSRMTGIEAKKIIESGELGDILQVEFDHHRGGWLNDTPSGQYRTKRASSGLMKMEGLHEIDLFRFWVGEIVALQSFCAPNALPHYEFPDNITTMLWFENGAQGRYTSSHTKSSYDIPPGSPGYSKVTGPQVGHIMRWGVVGTKGSMTLDAWTQRLDVYHFVAQPPGTNSLKPLLHRTLDFSGIADWSLVSHDITGCRYEFMERMAAGRPPLQSASDAFRSEAVALLCDQSAYEDGRRIEREEIEAAARV
jgi:predicted dehydrogenase